MSYDGITFVGVSGSTFSFLHAASGFDVIAGELGFGSGLAFCIENVENGAGFEGAVALAESCVEEALAFLDEGGPIP